MPHLKKEDIVACTPKGKRYWECRLCGYQNHSLDHVQTHLEKDHELAVELAGWAFYRK